MRKYKNAVVGKKQVHIITCNMCGGVIQKNEFGYFDEYFSSEKTWGYGSEHDGETHCIDMCKDCYKELINKMAVSPVSESKNNYSYYSLG